MNVVVFGAGYTGSRVAALAEVPVLATVRSEARARELEARALPGVVVTREPVLDVARAHVGPETHAIVCFPPDGHTDAELAPLLAHAAAVSYVSSTGIYGKTRGVVDDATPLPPRAELGDRARAILDAEDAYRTVGATILRAPGIYGPDRGLHRRIERGEHRIPGDGSAFLSRIHATDLARLLLASGRVRGETFVVGDLEPACQRDLSAFLCDAHGWPMPPFVPEEQVHETLRADRRIDPSRALARLGVTLRYPSFREGMVGPALTES